MKGPFNERPPRPKYHSVWDVDLVLNMFRRKGPSTSLPLEDLTIKTAMLFALTRPCRGADLAALDLNNRSVCSEGVLFAPSHLSKQSRPSHSGVEFFFPAFKEDECLCPVATLKAYKLKTKEFWQNKGENHLFRSFIGQRKAVSSSTIARWLRSCLQKAGVDTSAFQAHSVRAAASTKAAMSGVTVEDILKAADWSTRAPFRSSIISQHIQQHLEHQCWQSSRTLQNHMLIWKPSLPKYNFGMAQVMQWPPAIRNYMRMVRLKYQYVPPSLPIWFSRIQYIVFLFLCLITLILGPIQC